MSRSLHVDVSDLAKAQIRAAEEWWRLNRPKAPNAIREELERASLLISVEPEMGARARNVSLAGVRRIHLARVRRDEMMIAGFDGEGRIVTIELVGPGKPCQRE